MEYLDIVDDNGLPTGEIVERIKAHAEGIPHRTSHVWLIRRHEGELQILLQKRCMSKDSYPGCYDISSAGHIPAGFDFDESAVRELSEELGIDVSADELIVCGNRRIISDDIFHGMPFHDRQYSRVFALWCDLDAEAFTVQESELDGVLWMNFSECLKAVSENTIPHCIVLEELLMVQDAVLKGS